MKYEILNQSGDVINRIVADESFVQQRYPGSYRLIDDSAERFKKASANVRQRRDSLLTETDWVVVFHTEKGTNIPLEWEIYRQALRDITSHVSFPYLTDADWPAKL